MNPTGRSLAVVAVLALGGCFCPSKPTPEKPLPPSPTGRYSCANPAQHECLDYRQHDGATVRKWCMSGEIRAGACDPADVIGTCEREEYSSHYYPFVKDEYDLITIEGLASNCEKGLLRGEFRPGKAPAEYRPQAAAAAATEVVGRCDGTAKGVCLEYFGRQADAAGADCALLRGEFTAGQRCPVEERIASCRRAHILVHYYADRPWTAADLAWACKKSAGAYLAAHPAP